MTQPFYLYRGSGTQLGTLSECPIAQLVQIKGKATDPSAYGPVSGWTAAEVGELNFIIGKCFYFIL